MITAALEIAPLRVAFVGHVDHGKSTLIGRLLHDAGRLSASAREQIERLSRREGRDGLDLAFAVDQLREERERGITIDTTRASFASATREFEIIDVPGHAVFLRNMLSGATRADAAVLLVDVAQGPGEQTVRHALLLRLVGVRRILVAVNKLDLFDFAEERFREIGDRVDRLLGSLGVRPEATLPIAAGAGDNVVRRSLRMPWHRGPTLLEALDALAPDPARSHPLRFCVQDSIEVDGRRVLLGRVEGGAVGPGTRVTALPAGRSAIVREVLRLDGRRGGAIAGECPGLLVDGGDLRRGDVLADPASPPTVGRRARATLFWMGDPVAAGATAGTARIAGRAVPVVLEAIERRIDSASLAEDADRTRLAERDVADVVLRFDEPVVLEPHDVFPPLGRLTVESDRAVLAAGIVREVLP